MLSDDRKVANADQRVPVYPNPSRGHRVTSYGAPVTTKEPGRHIAGN